MQPHHQLQQSALQHQLRQHRRPMVSRRIELKVGRLGFPNDQQGFLEGRNDLGSRSHGQHPSVHLGPNCPLVVHPFHQGVLRASQVSMVASRRVGLVFREPTCSQNRLGLAAVVLEAVLECHQD